MDELSLKVNQKVYKLKWGNPRTGFKVKSMAKRGIKGITTMVAVGLAIVTLVVGLVVGMVVYPVVYPPPTIEEYEATIADLEADIADLGDTIDGLEATIDEYEVTIDALNAIIIGYEPTLARLEAAITELKDHLQLLMQEATEEAAAVAAVRLLTGAAPNWQALTGEIKIGAILTMTGDLATFGENEECAALFAIEEVNELLADVGAGWTMKLEVEDTGCLPDVCLEKVESLNARGIKLLIGPLSSSELANIMTYCNTEKILTISQSSTAPALGAVDFIFRYCPNDLWQGRAIARLMWEEGTRYVVPTWRGEAWGDGLEEQGEIRFEELGGTFLEGVRYTVPRTEFSVEAATLNDLVTSAVETYGADQVAVWAISFEEIAAYMTEARAYPNLASVKWYGSDGTVVVPGLIDPADPDLSAFAVTTEFINPIFSPLPATWKYDKVRNRVLDTYGRETDSYSYNIYDMVWAYFYSLLVVEEYDAEAIRAVLPDVVKLLHGATGWTEFDDNGDRAPTDYDLWVVSEVVAGVEYEWERVGKWVLATDTLEWL